MNFLLDQHPSLHTKLEDLLDKAIAALRVWRAQFSEEKQKPKIELLPVRPVWVDEDIINRQQLMLMIGKQEGCQAIITSRNQPNKLQR